MKRKKFTAAQIRKLTGASRSEKLKIRDSDVPPGMDKLRKHVSKKKHNK